MNRERIASFVRSLYRRPFGGMPYALYQKKFYSLQQVTLPNTPLVHDIERLCQQKGGFLTCGELFQEELYGTHGYYAKQSHTVLTDTPGRWSQAMVSLCRRLGIHHCIEVGPGDGRLAAGMLEEARKQKYRLSWSGVERADVLREKIASQLAQKNVHAEQIVQWTSDIQTREPSLFLFVYALDSMVPEIFVNTGKRTSTIESIVGVQIQNRVLTECILTTSQLKTRGISLVDGIFKRGHFALDLSSWQLLPMQRAYIPLQSLEMLSEMREKAPSGSRLCIIDEFRIDKGGYVSPHLLVPRDPRLYRRDKIDLEQNYKKIGTIDYYFPQYRYSLETYLASVGFPCEIVESEHALGEFLTLHKKLPQNIYAGSKKTLCILTKKMKKKSRKTLLYPLRYEDTVTSVSWDW